MKILVDSSSKLAQFGLVASIPSTQANLPKFDFDVWSQTVHAVSFAPTRNDSAKSANVSARIAWDQKEQWEDSDEKKFVSLAVLEAEDEISLRQLEQLEKLQEIRRKFKSPRNYEELIRERKQKEIGENLSRAIDAYLEVYSTL